MSTCKAKKLSINLQYKENQMYKAKETKSEQVMFRATPTTRDKLKRVAKRQGLTPSSYINLVVCRSLARAK